MVMEDEATDRPAGSPRTNWAGNVRYGAARVLRPDSVPDLQRIVGRASSVRAVGTGHSFNPIADTRGDLVSLDRVRRSVEVDRTARQARVVGAVRYGELGAELARAGLALPNTGSLPHISVAGACATGTHGSGTTNQTLAAGVCSLTLVGAEGDLVTLDRATAGADFDGCVVALGRLGIVVELVLDVVPTFMVAQTVVEGVDDAAVADDLQGILSAAYSVSVFTDWAGGCCNEVWLKEQVDRAGAWVGEPLWGGQAAGAPRNPVRGMPAENATAQLGVPGPWNERLPHFRLEFMPSSGEELQSEYFVPLEHAAAAWQALAEIRETVRPVLQICEIRAVAADAMWLSMAGGKSSIAFHFTWRRDPEAVAPVVATIEQRLAPFAARPHWAKVFTTAPEVLDHRYPRMGDFRRRVTEMDPRGKFGNDLVDGWLGLR